ncbi:Acriflavin resistance protein [Candidatus Magnetomoraceae bacterium gMMP-13]
MIVKSKTKVPKSIAWMARKSVVANLLMIVLLIGGAIMAFTQTKQEVFPDFDVDIIEILVPYPGASPDEVEKGIILAVEEAVRGLEGVKKVSSSALEGVGEVYLELLNDADKNRVTAEIKDEIDRITSFPLDVEEPVITVLTTRREVLRLVIYGDQDEKVLRHLADSVREDLLKEENITQVELAGIRPLEMRIEVAQANLRAYGLTLDGIAEKIKRSAIELPAGGVKTRGGEILLRTTERRDLGREFEELTILSTKDGSRLKLGDIARVIDGFEDQDMLSFFNGKPAVMVNVFRIGDQTPLDVAKSVKEYKKRLDKVLPSGVSTAIWLDRSEIFHQRIDLLKRNAVIGLLLVLAILGLFLEIRLAFWVTMGIPISFLGSFLFLPALDASINMISLFAFIITLGMVVDDAIVVGESVYVYREHGEDFIQASIKGASEVATPVFFSIMTSVTAFSPMLFVPGIWGKIFHIFPAVIASVLLISLFESLYILPAHLAHLKEPQKKGLNGKFYLAQQRFGKMVERASQNIYGPIVRWAVHNQWITWAIALSILIIAIGLIKGERINIEVMPKVESDWIVANARLPFGVSLDETKKVQKIIENAVQKVINEETEGRPSELSRGIFTSITASHSIRVIAFLLPSDERNIDAISFSQKWRTQVGDIPGLEFIEFNATAGGPQGGKPIDVQLSHKDMDILEKASAEFAVSLKAYDGVSDIDDGFSPGKPQLNFTIKPEAISLGITATELGRQVRSAFWGAEALRQQRGRDMIRVIVRLPEEERKSEYDIEELLIRSPEGGEIPLFQAAEVKRGRSYTSISRTDGKRTVNVTAEIDTQITSSGKVNTSLIENELPKLMKRYPGLSYSYEGAAREGEEAMSNLVSGFIIALMVMYVLIAIPFNSYIQPIAVLSAIPFGIVGAIIGHILMGYDLSLISMMGLVALSGVVVNDSLVLVHTANKMRDDGMIIEDAVCTAGIRRFRPILLTSLTTFLGLTPMIFETSFQARFLIPMAISLGFGVLFATFIILLIVPAFYIIVQNVKEIFGEIFADFMKIMKIKNEKI